MKRSSISDWVYFRRVLGTLAMVAIAYLAWKIAALFILLFAAVLIAVLLSGAAGLVARHSSLTRGWALAACSLAIALAIIGLLSFFGAQIAAQVSDVFGRLPAAIDAAGERFDIPNAFKRLQEAVSSEGGGQLLSTAANLGYTAAGIAIDLILVVVVALYLAADPRLYRAGLIKLLPPEQHDRTGEALDVATSALRLWFLGQLVAMALVGLLCGLAFWAIGLPSPLGLGVIAGLTNFVPLIGPIIGAVPAVLFAFTVDISAVLWTVAAVLVIQQLEGNLITPMVQQRAVDIPPALMLLGMSAFGVLGGTLGVIFAVPLTVAIMVLVQKLWIRETLGEKTTIPGEK